MSFFPSDLEIANLQSPLDILSEAKLEWDSKGQGIISLLVDEGHSTFGSDSQFVMIHVYALHIPSQRLARLLTVVHVTEKPYPARIDPEKEDIPDYLRKESAGPVSPPPQAFIETIRASVSQYKRVDEWVCESPDEFRRQLVKALNLGSVKATVTNIVTVSSADDEAGGMPAQPEIESGEGSSEIGGELD
jgi:hypothetical protein